MTLRLWLLALGAAIAVACGDDSADPPPSHHVPTDGGEGGAGGTGTGGRSGTGGANAGMSGDPGGADTGGSSGRSGEGGEGGQGNAGSAGTSGTGGMAGTGGMVIPPCPSDSEAGAPSDIAGACDAGIAWGSAVVVPTSTGTVGQFLSITPDELTMATYSATLMGTNFAVSDRAASTDPFDAGQTLELRDYVTLSPDGLRLVGLVAGHAAFFELTRAARGDVFGMPAEGTFATINADAAARSLTFEAGAISGDDRTFYYLALGSGSNDDPLRMSRRTGTGNWPVGSPVAACELQRHGTSARRPTGASADGLTLFYFDEVRGIERAAFRASLAEPFSWFEDLGDRNGAQPNTSCDRLYFGGSSQPSYSVAE